MTITPYSIEQGDTIRVHCVIDGTQHVKTINRGDYEAYLTRRNYKDNTESLVRFIGYQIIQERTVYESRIIS